MTDQTIPADVTPEDMAHARAYVQDFLDATHGPDRTLAVARVLQALLPTPPRPTLADMTLDEQDECTGMQADLAQGDRVVILDGTPDHDDRVQVLESTLDVYRPVAADVTPRPDLTRLTLPGTEKPAPAPALPDGWRLADHPDHGRVVVTNTIPNRNGHVHFVLPTIENTQGYDWDACRPDELTYIDTGREADQ